MKFDSYNCNTHNPSTSTCRDTTRKQPIVQPPEQLLSVLLLLNVLRPDERMMDGGISLRKANGLLLSEAKSRMKANGLF